MERKLTKDKKYSEAPESESIVASGNSWYTKILVINQILTDFHFPLRNININTRANIELETVIATNTPFGPQSTGTDSQ